ncbi:MAG: DoxX family protein [Candidatus Paceibacterota bacterium]|jgi:putative oxidoreductase
MIQPLLMFSDWGLLALRIVLGAILIAHGWPKIKDLRRTAENFEMMNFMPGMFWGVLVALVEFVGGIFFIAGFFTQIIALMLTIEFLVVVFKVKWNHGFVEGYEFDLLIAAVACLFAFVGSGAWGLDQILSISIL